MKKLWNKIKRNISVIHAIKHDVAIRMHFNDYESLRKYKGQDKAFAISWINKRIKHYILTGKT